MLHRAWFLSPVARHDYLLGAAIVYVAVQNGHYSDDGGGERGERDKKDRPSPPPLPTKKTLIGALLESHRLWVLTIKEQPDARPAAEMLRVMVQKVCPETAAAAGSHPVAVAGEQTSLDKVQTEAADVPWSTSTIWHQKAPPPQQPRQLNQQQDHQWPTSMRAALGDGSGRPWQQQYAVETDIMEPTRPLSSLSLADNNNSNSSSSGGAVFSGTGTDSGSPAMAGTPGPQQVPVNTRGLVPSPAVPMAVDGEARSGMGTPWMVPMNTEALDWTLMDDVIRANSENTTEWVLGADQQQPQPPLVEMELGFDPQFWVR
ncbi:hypothetical protein MAPG_09885 [Magnaporthiopsis poae ATCC 64411]|uniref:Uncharacterized protein n=1 Tax=Magnaporthiopsis poae (strain ATCC 64411 / 73-15) TaxID=644358 RepID=A0A0C4EB40_MAGP6|nr:hypothetical protein MAPG_09885 [Magnaporthiopsis poae ATCC 64411]